MTKPGTISDISSSYTWFCSDLALFLCLSDQSSEVKLGNPLLVLLQAPFQLLSHLLFDRQVSPDRYALWLSPINVGKVHISL